MTAVEAPRAVDPGPRPWPLSVPAYHALGDLGLIPEKTELLYAYATADIQECWLVLGPEQPIEVHRQPLGGPPAAISLHGPGGSVTSTEVPHFTVDLTQLFRTY